jgi:hypothetical protein
VIGPLQMEVTGLPDRLAAAIRRATDRLCNRWRGLNCGRKDLAGSFSRKDKSKGRNEFQAVENRSHLTMQMQVLCIRSAEREESESIK